MKWEQKTLAELCNKLTDGTHDSPKLQPSGMPFIKGVHVKQGIINFENCDYITFEEHEKVIKRSKPERNDILLANIGINIGELGYVKTDIEFSIKNVALLKVNQDEIDSRYLYYNLKNPTQQERLRNHKGGSAQPFLSLETLRGYKIQFHKLNSTQRKIASILSAYDDLIENNLKRIKLLEEKAQLHYKELMQESSKWDRVRLEEFVSVVKGRKPANVLEQPEDDSLLYLLLDTVERTKTLYTSDLTLPLSKDNDVLMCMDGARSGLAFRGMNGAIGSTMAIWRSNSERVSGEFLYQFMKQNESAIIQGNTGAAIPHANRKFILDMKMAIPPKKEAEDFDGLTLPMIKLINTLHNQNTKLREARDILLPKLMNGQIEV
ncbi:restriction endonuclease subunit S [Kaistella sp.]|uniref:restriction endonuclease subunit S n=1 Tax=Kaistella sp. TaxID=2782235 RepID=UPI002F95CF62